MRCPNCYGPVSKVRGLGKSQPTPQDRVFFRCLSCGADFSLDAETNDQPQNQQSVNSRMPVFQMVWPRLRP